MIELDGTENAAKRGFHPRSRGVSLVSHPMAYCAMAADERQSIRNASPAGFKREANLPRRCRVWAPRSSITPAVVLKRLWARRSVSPAGCARTCRPTEFWPLPPRPPRRPATSWGDDGPWPLVPPLEPPARCLRATCARPWKAVARYSMPPALAGLPGSSSERSATPDSIPSRWHGQSPT